MKSYNIRKIGLLLPDGGRFRKGDITRDTKEIAVMLCKMNRVGEEGGMTLEQASKLLGVPRASLGQWINDHNLSVAENETEYLERLRRRERLLLDKLFSPIELALDELTHRLMNEPEAMKSNDLVRMIDVITSQYMKVYLSRLDREKIAHQNEGGEGDESVSEELNEIFQGAIDRLVIDGEATSD